MSFSESPHHLPASQSPPAANARRSKPTRRKRRRRRATQKNPPRTPSLSSAPCVSGASYPGWRALDSDTALLDVVIPHHPVSAAVIHQTVVIIAAGNIYD
jgi:hypothetical protein